MEYKNMLIEMTTITADTRAPKEKEEDDDIEIDPGDIDDDDDDDPEDEIGNTGNSGIGGTDNSVSKFSYTKPVLNFSNFKAPGSDPDMPDSDPSRPIEFYRITEIFDQYGMPKTGFSALRPQNLSEQPLSVKYEPADMTIQLPKLDVRSEIVTVPFIGDEYPVDWLGSAVGMLEGSSFPGKGVTVLTGHNHLNAAEAGPFVFLGELEAGDRIMITDRRGVMQIWRVYENVKVAADGFGGIAGDVKENSLVLITCEDESIGGGYLNRRIILAEQGAEDFRCQYF